MLLLLLRSSASGAGVRTAQAAGVLPLTGAGMGQVRLSGGAVGVLTLTGAAIASGNGEALAPAALRVLAVARDERTLTVPAEDRTLIFTP